MYLAKRSTDKAVFQRFLALIERPGSGELVFFVLTDRQTDNNDRRNMERTCALVQDTIHDARAYS